MARNVLAVRGYPCYSGDMQIKRGDIVKIKRGGITGGMDWEVLRVADGHARVDLVRGSLLGPQWEALEDLELIRRPLPDPTVTGPCQAQATFMCTTQAAGERLDPRAMLPGSTVSADYVPMCTPCYDHLADAFVSALHS